MKVGKFYPRQIINWVDTAELNGIAGPTRKVKLHPLGTFSQGTVAALWIGADVVSDVAQRDSSPLWTYYTFTNPTDSLATIKLKVLFEIQTPRPGIGLPYQWRSILEAYYNGVFLARNTTTPEAADLWKWPANSTTQVGPGWADKTNTTLWNQISFRWGAAQWSDQPEYHPYRH